MIVRRSVFAVLTSLGSLCAVVLVMASVAVAATPPVIEDESVLDAAGTSATLQATINPEGSDTTYRFEYGTSEAYGSAVPAPDGPVGSGSSGVVLNAHLPDLTPDTRYHYRVVAMVASRSETVAGGDGSFTTQRVGSGFSLLDGRQWEMVSPPNKHGANIYALPSEYLTQAADDGHAFTWVTNAPTEAEPEGFVNEVNVLSERSSDGWSSKDIATPRSSPGRPQVGVGTEYRFFSPDLSLALVEPQGRFTPLSADATERTPYIRDNAECKSSPTTCYTPLVTAAKVPPGTQFGGQPLDLLGLAQFIDGSPDFSHLVVESSVPLTSTPGDKGGVYDWSDGVLRPIGVLPESEAIDEGRTLVDGRLGNADEDVRHAISNDGSRIFWEEANKLYLRDSAKGETLRIGGSELTAFQAASSDGSRVFFTSSINSAAPRALEECDVVETAGKLSCVTTQLAPEILGQVSAVSEDGSSVYFASNAVLAPDAIAGTCVETHSPPADELCNLYVERRGNGGWESPKLVAVLSARDQTDWEHPRYLTARASGNGGWFAFMSQRDLTGYDTRDVVTGEPDEEVYLYDASAEKLLCASCNPTGGRPTGGKEFGSYSALFGYIQGPVATASVPSWTVYGWYRSIYQSRYLSDDGRLFFNSGDALVPQDVNGAWDVYEYEPPGVGSCTAASVTFDSSADGCVDLLSSGASPEDSAFMDASGSGGDVFFMTASHLTAQDFDTSYDVYDAHACSPSVPCPASVTLPPPCSTGDSCKAAPSLQPATFGAPASATFAGVGNVVGSPESVTPRSLTRAQKLRRALRACQKKKRGRGRAVCERKARARYQAKKATRGSR